MSKGPTLPNPTLRPSKAEPRYRQRKVAPIGEPKEDCQDCPRLKQCPLVRYIYPCSLKAMYIRQDERNGL